MFNKKLLTALLYIVAVLLAVKAVFVITMFVWSYFGTPPLALFNPAASALLNYVLLLQELGSIVFFYIVLSVARYLTCCDCECKTESKPVSAFGFRRPAAPKKK